MEVIKISKKKRYTFNKTGLITVIDNKNQPAEGYTILANFLSISVVNLGFEKVIPPKTLITLNFEDNSRLVCKVDDFKPLCIGTLKHIFLWIVSYKLKENKKRKQEPKPCILKYSKIDSQVSNELEMLRILEHPFIFKLVAFGWDKNIGDVMVMESVGIPIEIQASNPAET
jgi:hypothetical protein